MKENERGSELFWLEQNVTCQLIFVWLEIGSWTCLVWILSVSDFIGIGNWRNFSWRQNLVSKKICLLKETLLDDLRPWQSLYLPSRCYILDSITYFIHFLILHKKNEHFLFQIILMMNTPFIPIILVPKQQKKKHRNDQTNLWSWPCS